MEENMSDLNSLQQARLAFLQGKLRRIRSICGFCGNDLAVLLGVTRQTIANLEMTKTALAPPMLLALAAVLEEYCRKTPEAAPLLDLCMADFPMPPDWSGPKPDAANLASLWFSAWPEQFSPGAGRESRSIQSFELMELVSANFKIFFCPDILLFPAGISRLEDLCALAGDCGNVVNIPGMAFRKIAEDLPHETKTRIAALQHERTLVLRGEEEDPPLASLLLEKFIQLRTKYNLCLVTNDETLAFDILKLNDLKSLLGRPILALKLDQAGEIGLWDEKLADALLSRRTQDLRTTDSRRCESQKLFPREEFNIPEAPGVSRNAPVSASTECDGNLPGWHEI